MKQIISKDYNKILDSDVNLVTVPKFLSDDQKKYVELLSSHDFCYDSWDDIIKYCPDYYASNFSCKSALVADLNLWVLRFVLLTGKKPNIKLESQFQDSCRIFHEDNNYIRMICTLHGPTTEFLEEENCNREHLCKPHASWQEQNNKIVKDHSNIIKYPNGWISFMKGRSANNKGILHRAPLISSSGQRRLVFIVD
jgi:hypothetical protein